MALIFVAAFMMALGAVMPAAAHAAPAAPGGVGADLADKQAWAAQVSAQLAAMRSDLASQLAQYERAESLLDMTHGEMALTDERLRQLDGEIAAARSQVESSAVRMYKSGNLPLLEILLGTSSVDDLLTRIDFLILVQRHDSDILAGLRTDRAESMELRIAQQRRQAQLVGLKQQAEARRGQVQAEIVRQAELIASIDADIADLVRQKEEAEARALADAATGGEEIPAGTSQPPVAFDPNTVITDANYIASKSMTAEQIQRFLEGRAGTLATYSGPDHNGVRKTAAEMIADAALGWGVSPKVILVTLQKEQSLLEKKSPTKTAYDWAMGCGKTDSVTYYQYQGFGNQIWWGAQKLNKNRGFWESGMSITIDGAAVYPSNPSTHALYRYTPHFPGVKSFWRLHWLYFGDPLK